MNPPKVPTILIADDEVYMLRLLEMTLKKGGFTVVSFRDGEAALALAAANQGAAFETGSSLQPRGLALFAGHPYFIFLCSGNGQIKTTEAFS